VAARFFLARVPQNSEYNTQFARVVDENFQELKNLIQRAIIDNELVGDTSLSGDVTGTLGVADSTEVVDVSILTTRGDVLRRNATAAERLALGAANSILSSDGTDVTYQTLAALLEALGSTDGQILRRSGGAWEALSLGADNTILASDGTDAQYETLTSLIDAAIGSTRGAILYRGASGWAILAPGTSGQVLETQGAGADPQWAASSAGGSPSWVSTGGVGWVWVGGFPLEIV
jgi:hypothetical protein